MSREHRNIPFLHGSVTLLPQHIFPENLKYVSLEIHLDSKERRCDVLEL